MKTSTRLLLAALATCPYLLPAQPYTGGRHTRHRFAQLTVGIDGRALLPAGPKGTTGYETRAIIGGTHFWGHADFYIAIPTLSSSSNTRTGAETGMRLYPWAIKSGGLRPYAGIGIAPITYQQGAGTRLTRLRTPLYAGLTYCAGRHQLTADAGWNYNNRILYYTSTTQSTQRALQSLMLGVGYKWMLETTLSAEKNWLSGRTKKLTDTLARRRRLNGFTLAAGPSSLFYTKPSAYTGSYPYLDNLKVTAVFADLGIGYYWHRPDVQLNVAYRGYADVLKAYGHTLSVSRRSLAVECYKFLADYHGFVPFAGAAISHEWLSVTESLPGASATHHGPKLLSPGVTFGWDIRPDRLQSFYLRTNLRYFPGLDVAMPTGQAISLSGLEVNFIQLVVFPGRMFGKRHRPGLTTPTHLSGTSNTRAQESSF